MDNKLDRFDDFMRINMLEENGTVNAGSNSARSLAGRYLPMAITAILLFFAAKLII